MKDFSGTIAARPVEFGPRVPAAEKPASVSSSRRFALILVTFAAVAITVAHASVAGSDTASASGFGYLYTSLSIVLCSIAFATRVHATRGIMRVRWALITSAVFFNGVAFLPSFCEGLSYTSRLRQLQTCCFNLSEALFMLACVLFFTGATRAIVILDTLQALLFAVLRYHLIYSPKTWDHFAPGHLLVGQLVATLLFLVPTVACFGASSREELRFLRTLSFFFGLRLIGFFLADQVSSIWLHFKYCSLWDVPDTALMGAFTLYLLATTRSATVPDNAPLPASRLVVRNLMPCFLALVNLMLGLFLLRGSMTLAAAAISIAVISHVVRTVLLQTQEAKAKTQLQSRNEQLEGLATRDPLTGIGNRRSLASIYSRLQSAAREENVALLLMDIDHFKQANDRHGHLHGDQVLIALARKLESLSAGLTGSHSARFGGDEFALLIPGMSSQRASSLAGKLRVAFTSHAIEAGLDTVSLSIGVAAIEGAHTRPLEALIASADEALYRAKLLGRDRVEVQSTWERETDPSSALNLHLQHTIS